MTYLELINNADYKLSHNQITFGDYNKMIEPLRTEITKNGEWIVDKKYTKHFSDGRNAIVYSVHCSECNYFSTDNMYRMPYKFCPNCGAYMGGEEDDTDCD